MKDHKISGSISGPVLAFLGVLVVGLAVAAFLFIPKFKEVMGTDADTDDEVAVIEEPGSTSATVTDTAAPKMTEASSPESTPETKPSPYMTDSVWVSDLSAKLRSGDVAGFLELVGSEAATATNKERLKSLFVDRKYVVDSEQPQVELSSSADAKKWGINLKAPESSKALGDQQIQLEVANAGNQGWKMLSLAVPDIEAIAAKFQAKEMPAEPVAGAADKNKPVEIAKAFFEAVLSRDFREAKAHVNSERLTDEKLAALFIVVEEGEFKPHSKNALIATAAQDLNAWVIARLQSAAKESDFGIEMERKAATQPWKVVGLNFSKLIQAQAAALGAGDIAYTPIKKNLKGGDSLVLYFEYDDSGLNPRASKQLGIIAEILRQDPKRQLHINGHADAMGDENYNEGLSNLRASNVRDSLIAAGIPAAQIVTKAYGESAPKAPNLNPDGTDNPTGRAQNRRAEVYLDF